MRSAIKKQVVIKCEQILSEEETSYTAKKYIDEFCSDGFIVKTLEGPHTGLYGDWLMVGVEGEPYICKDSIFKKTYDLCKKL